MSTRTVVDDPKRGNSPTRQPTAAAQTDWTNRCFLEALFHVGPLAQSELGRSHAKRRRPTLHYRAVDAEGRSLIEASSPGHLAEIGDEFSALSPDEQQHLASLCRKLGLAALPIRVSSTGNGAPAAHPPSPPDTR
jgi:hypothetical protein